MDQKCRLCGKHLKLTYEHVPPEKAFNSHAVREYSQEEAKKIMSMENGRMPWDYEGLNYKINQRGAGDFYLCPQCNNNTGSWYINDYVNFTKIINAILQHIEKNHYHQQKHRFQIKQIYPLRIFKAIMTMFCDINYDCFGDEKLRNFLLNKESNELDTDKYKLYMYLTKGPTIRRISSTAMYPNPLFCDTVSEISFYPLGLILCINQQKTDIDNLCNVTDLVSWKYNDCIDVTFNGIPLYEVNTHIPLDFRTKEELKRIL